MTDCEDNPQKPDGCTFDQEFTDEQGSWIGSMYTLGQVFSVPAVGVVMTLTTRKTSLLLTGILYLIGWTILGLTEPLNLDEVVWFYIGRFILGKRQQMPYIFTSLKLAKAFNLRNSQFGNRRYE